MIYLKKFNLLNEKEEYKIIIEEKKLALIVSIH